LAESPDSVRGDWQMVTILPQRSGWIRLFIAWPWSPYRRAVPRYPRGTCQGVSHDSAARPHESGSSAVQEITKAKK